MVVDALKEAGETLIEPVSIVVLLMFFIHYFMRREERREKFIAAVIGANTKALIALAFAISKTEAGKHIDDSILDNLGFPTEDHK